MPWFVIYTKARNEKIVAQKLHEQGIDVYCPLVATRRRWSDRVKTVQEPLFRSYCFVNLAEQERSRVFAVPGVVRYLFWLKKPAIARDEEIEAIKLMLNDIEPGTLMMTQFQPGDRATIASGSFAGMAGSVVRQQGKIVSIRLDCLQTLLTVNVSKTMTVS